MSSIPFARQAKAVGYGHDILCTLGTTTNDEVIEFTADRILSLNVTWAQATTPLTADIEAEISGLRREDIVEAALSAGVDQGALRIKKGSAHLYNPIIDQPAATAAALIDAVAGVAPEPQDDDARGRALALNLSRPSGAHLRGGNIVAADGTLRTPLSVPRLTIVQVFAPGEKRQVSATSRVEPETVAELEQAKSIDDLLLASRPLVEDLQDRESIVADILEMQDDLPLLTGILPGADTGVAIPFPGDVRGLTQAQAFAQQLREVIPDLVVSPARTWKKL